MNVPTTIDAGAWLSKYLEGANGDTDLARSMLGAFADAIRGPGVHAVQRWLRRAHARARELAQWISDPALGHEARHDRTQRPQVAPRGLSSPRCSSTRAGVPSKRSWR
jgi:hypothetical protein